MNTLSKSKSLSFNIDTEKPTFLQRNPPPHKSLIKMTWPEMVGYLFIYLFIQLQKVSFSVNANFWQPFRGLKNISKVS